MSWVSTTLDGKNLCLPLVKFSNDFPPPGDNWTSSSNNLSIYRALDPRAFARARSSVWATVQAQDLVFSSLFALGFGPWGRIAIM